MQVTGWLYERGQFWHFTPLKSKNPEHIGGKFQRGAKKNILDQPKAAKPWPAASEPHVTLSLSTLQSPSQMSSASRSLRSSISPFRSRKSPAPLPPAPAKGVGGARQTTPSSSKSRLKPTSITPSSWGSLSTPVLDRPDSSKGKENVTVTVRFRPLRYGRVQFQLFRIFWFCGLCRVGLLFFRLEFVLLDHSW